MKESFGSMSLEALSKSTQQFLQLAKSTLEPEREYTKKELESKKGLIDQQLGKMTGELEKVSTLMKELEKDRVEKFGQLSNQLRITNQQTSELMKTTGSIREALASTKTRGQWGERMAEDVLRLAGFVENINYVKQKTLEGTAHRPDFTFMLPKDLTINMDVKFPLNNFVNYLEAQSEGDKEAYKSTFLKDVKLRLKEVVTKDYINPESNTVDYVILFIPNEQIYSFIQEEDSSIFDTAIQNKVLLCSPVNFFAVLAIIRQAIDNFAIEQTSKEMLVQFGAFKKQWDAFVAKFDTLGQRIEAVQKEYEVLTTTRKRAVERPLNKIENIRKQKGLPASDDEQGQVPKFEVIDSDN
ncbi:MAG: DNA recombination protein RmuC [Candidatus Dadabacteria bacterium]|nr:DNA recombination protein RmuC [Candidatus Dadabacteria bacterium]NIS07970.1 DNA recombination protein RmuC [Candidatus Dadabacteria bacterium]NIV43091.1 DNA recombination protein RmuC [Candidatus Dadabacteria bacterium]NIX14927.1 DNA recombination protein RmuC [Candidatus Dadabacteria bacterium]NIY21554.1 DNA recombination protein RmuC [Candidatus Dadabacteria bacterium]